MQTKEYFEYAGNLIEELGEVDKLISDDGIEMAASQTRLCSTFLTIYCC